MIVPGVYYVRCDKHDNTPYYRLEFAFPRFEVPSRIYGDVTSNMVRVWNEYAISGKSTGVMLTGASGNSKTLSGQILSNLAIDNELPVVMVTEVKFTIELIAYITRLTNCVIFLDEFRKNISYDLEAQSLTMFSDLGNTKKLFILTENDKSSISSYIRNRPGRFRYHLDFEKISKSVFEDYVNSHDVRDSFKKELQERYNNSTVFSFDHLQAIISEHMHYPDDPVDDIFAILNVETLRRPKIFKLLDIKCVSEPEKVFEYTVTSSNMSESNIKAGYNVWVNVWDKNNKEEKKFNYNITEINFNYSLFRLQDEEDNIYLATSRCGNYEAKFQLDYADGGIRR